MVVDNLCLFFELIFFIYIAHFKMQFFVFLFHNSSFYNKTHVCCKHIFIMLLLLFSVFQREENLEFYVIESSCHAKKSFSSFYS